MADLTPEHLARLREVAEKATPGEWCVSGEPLEAMVRRTGHIGSVCTMVRRTGHGEPWGDIGPQFLDALAALRKAGCASCWFGTTGEPTP